MPVGSPTLDPIEAESLIDVLAIAGRLQSPGVSVSHGFYVSSPSVKFVAILEGVVGSGSLLTQLRSVVCLHQRLQQHQTEV